MPGPSHWPQGRSLDASPGALTRAKAPAESSKGSAIGNEMCGIQTATGNNSSEYMLFIRLDVHFVYHSLILKSSI